jgi:hypothetical protein
MNQQQQFNTSVRRMLRLVKRALLVAIVLCSFLIYLLFNPDFLGLGSFFSTDPQVEVEEEEFNKVENGIHVRTGFVEGNGLMAVVNNCTNCHSAKLVTQNRMSKERWRATIRWMQETQNLWDLGENEEIIVNYLATHYAPDEQGRRPPLENIEWYDLE